MKKTTKQNILTKEKNYKLKDKKIKVAIKKQEQEQIFEKSAQEYFTTTNILNGAQNILFNCVSLTSEQKQIEQNIKTQTKQFNQNAKQNNEKTTTFKNMLLKNVQIDEQTKTKILIFNNINIINVKQLEKEKAKQLQQYFVELHKNNNFKSKNNNNKEYTNIFIDIDLKNKINDLLKAIFNCDYNFSFNDIRKIYQKAYDYKQKKVK